MIIMIMLSTSIMMILDSFNHTSSFSVKKGTASEPGSECMKRLAMTICVISEHSQALAY